MVCQSHNTSKRASKWRAMLSFPSLFLFWFYFLLYPSLSLFLPKSLLVCPQTGECACLLTGRRQLVNQGGLRCVVWLRLLTKPALLCNCRIRRGLRTDAAQLLPRCVILSTALCIFVCRRQAAGEGNRETEVRGGCDCYGSLRLLGLAITSASSIYPCQQKVCRARRKPHRLFLLSPKCLFSQSHLFWFP